MGNYDPDKRQEIINEPQEGDDTPVAMTHYQAMKCAGLIHSPLVVMNQKRASRGLRRSRGSDANYLQAFWKL